MLCDFYGIGQTYQENLLTKYYRILGHEVVNLASTTTDIIDFNNGVHNSKTPTSVEYEYGAKIIRLHYAFNIKSKLRAFKGVKKILKEEKPDLIIAHDIHFNLAEAAAYKKKSGCKLIMDYHADYTNSAKNWVSLNILHKLIRKKYFKKYQKYIDKIYPVVPGSVRFLTEVYSVSPNDMEILPLGCDYSKIQTVKNGVNRTKLRRKMGIAPNDIVILTGGKFHILKNTHLAIEAVKILNRKDVHLILFGKADKGFEKYEEEMKVSAKGYNIHFLGWIKPEESYKYMAISDIALFPSSQSVIWQQCIGAHLPIIAGDLGQQDMSYLNQNSNLIRVSTENLTTEYFAKVIDNLIETPEALEIMKRGAEKTAREYLDYKIIAEKTLS